MKVSFKPPGKMFVRHVRSSAEAAGDAIFSCPLCRVRENLFCLTKLDELAEMHEGRVPRDAGRPMHVECYDDHGVSLRKVVCIGSLIIRAHSVSLANTGLSGGRAWAASGRF